MDQINLNLIKIESSYEFSRCQNKTDLMSTKISMKRIRIVITIPRINENFKNFSIKFLKSTSIMLLFPSLLN